MFFLIFSCWLVYHAKDVFNRSINICLLFIYFMLSHRKYVPVESYRSEWFCHRLLKVPGFTFLSDVDLINYVPSCLAVVFFL